MWGDIAWKQIEDEEYGAVDAEKGEAETENIDDMHGEIGNSRVGELGCVKAYHTCPATIYVPASGQAIHERPLCAGKASNGA